jgi:hypothetical protein
LIAKAYRDPLQKVELPGKADLELSRKGAYAIYCEGQRGTYSHAEWPPTLDCSLTSQTTGEDIPLVPDYVPTNKYSTKDGDRVGVMIYSTTVQDPGLHTLSCDYHDVWTGPRLVLAIGPNYVWELLKIALSTAGSLFGALVVLCGSGTMAVVVAIVIAVKRPRSKRAAVGG